MESWSIAAFLSSKTPPKLRLFVIDRATGRPVTGVRVEAWATLRPSAAGEAATAPAKGVRVAG